MRDPQQITKADSALTTLDTAYVGSVQSNRIRKALLAKPERLPLFPYCRSQFPAILKFIHTSIFAV